VARMVESGMAALEQIGVSSGLKQRFRMSRCRCGSRPPRARHRHSQPALVARACDLDEAGTMPRG